MFKQFDIDYDKVTLDGITLNKPSYLSVSQWHEFWHNFDKSETERQMKASFDEGYQSHTNEHEKEIDQIKNFIVIEIDELLKTIDKLTEDDELDSYTKLTQIKDELEDSRAEIWQL